MKKMTYEINNDAIAQIIMNDGKVNSMNNIFFEELTTLLNKTLEDNAKIVVFSGNNKIFSGGLDLPYLISLSQDHVADFVEQFARTMIKILTLPIPTIAVCNGHTVAAGLILALVCDIRFISDGNYKIQMNETMNGIAIPMWMLLITKLTIPPQYRHELLLHSHIYTPHEAVNKGLFHGVINKNPDIIKELKHRIDNLMKIDMNAYTKTKQRMVDEHEFKKAIEAIKKELKD